MPMTQAPAPVAGAFLFGAGAGSTTMSRHGAPTAQRMVRGPAAAAGGAVVLWHPFRGAS
jgi:hypothetical protein